MNKRIFALLVAVLLCIASVAPAFASDATQSNLVDNAGLLDEYEYDELLSMLNEVSERQQMDVVICTVNSLDGATPQAYADDFYDYNGYGYGTEYDGVLLLIAIDEGKWHISTSGYGITAFTDAGIQYIGDQITSDLSAGDFYYAFCTYVELCDQFISQANDGVPFDVDNMPEEPFSVFWTLVVSLIIGAVVALIVTLIMFAQLKSVHFQSAAADYEKPGSMHITNSREFFLYRHVDRQKKAEQSSGGSSTHTSSSGRTHGGGGGSF